MTVRAARSSMDLVARVRAGEQTAVARLITRAESGAADIRPAMAELYRHCGHAHIVGITGVPGSGKSSLLRHLAEHAADQGARVAIVAVDPSSPFSGGAILGDRIRMKDVGAERDVFIRSVATRGALGGLARASMDAADVLDAAGYDLILVETVGVGQDEVDIVRAAHTTAVVSAPGLGDDIQAIKAGILEIADIHTVSKCDRADANATVKELKNMLTMALDPRASWRVPVVSTSSERREGIDELLTAIHDHRRHLVDSGQWMARCRRIAEARILKLAEEMIREGFERRRGDSLAPLLDAVAAHERDPHSAAAALIAQLQGSGNDVQQPREATGSGSGA